VEQKRSGGRPSAQTLRGYSSLFAEFNKSPKAELALMVRIQEYCYENMNFSKFPQIVVLLYKSESKNRLLLYKTSVQSKVLVFTSKGVGVK